MATGVSVVCFAFTVQKIGDFPQEAKALTLSQNDVRAT